VSWSLWILSLGIVSVIGSGTIWISSWSYLHLINFFFYLSELIWLILSCWIIKCHWFGACHISSYLDTIISLPSHTSRPRARAVAWAAWGSRTCGAARGESPRAWRPPCRCVATQKDRPTCWPTPDILAVRRTCRSRIRSLVFADLF